MTEFDLKNWLQTTSVVWELTLPGLNFWLGNTIAYIILHLQKSAASATQTATCREENSPEQGATWMAGCGGGEGPARRRGGLGLCFDCSFLQEGSLLACLAHSIHALAGKGMPEAYLALCWRQ